MSHRGVGMAAIAAALYLVGCAAAAAPPPSSGPGEPAVEPVESRAWPVMGTMLQVTVWGSSAERRLAGLAAARAAVQEVDSLMSVYRDDSELSTINRRAGSDSATVVSAETATVLRTALALAQRSGGALDVTVGPLVDIWGFYRQQAAMPDTTAIDSARALVDYRDVELDPVERTVRLPRSGMRLDFGAIAKGYAVDRAVDALQAMGIERAMVDLGGNLRLYGDPPEGGWWVGLRDPRSTDETIAAVLANSGSVATSGDYERFFFAGGVRYSHIIDPRTGWPARGVAGVSVIAPTGLLSDALSTALFVLGPASGCQLARAAGVEAVWVLDAGPTDLAMVVTPGLTAEKLRTPAAPRAC